MILNLIFDKVKVGEFFKITNTFLSFYKYNLLFGLQ
jgi:hypothetical protein